MSDFLLFDSITSATLPGLDSENAVAPGAVAVTGSHGGLYPATIASRHNLHAAIFNDAGIGFQNAGVVGLEELDKVHMAAAAADTYSCCIGSAEDTLQRGVISTANKAAQKAGVAPGMTVAEAAGLLQHATSPTAVLPGVTENIKFRKIESNGARVVLIDSASLVNSSHIDQWVVTGSHGTLPGGDPQYALKAAAALAVFNDAGRGLGTNDNSRLPALAERGIAAVNVDFKSAIIGNAESSFDDGVISAVNRVAEHKGANCGTGLAHWLGTLPPPNDYSLAQFDEHWRAVDTATLVFVLDGTNVLLIRKKRGLGAGKINGPGGKLESGETPRQCAIREVQEELAITPADLHERGELRFQFADGYSIHVHVYVAHNYSGIPQETDEAVPLWFPVDEIPYGEMWEDDQIWLPQVLNRCKVNGRFIFDNDRMLAHEVEFK